jgi:putative transposase
MRSAQTNIFDQLATPSAKRENKRRLIHGGVKSKGKRKLKRPVSTKQWIHLVLKSDKAVGKLSFLAKNNAGWIDQLIKKKAKKFAVEVKEFVNMGNHIHFQVRVADRKYFQNFLRSITSLIARHVTGARKGRPFGKFWQGLAFTRVVTSFLELSQLEKYLLANRIQLRKGYGARERYLASVNDWIQSLRR